MFIAFYLQLIQDLKKENFDLKLRLFMEQKEREVGVGPRKNEDIRLSSGRLPLLSGVFMVIIGR